MKFGVNTLLWTASFDIGHLDLLPRIKDAGFDGVEISRFSFDKFPAAKIRRALEANQLQCTLCSALTGNLSMARPDSGAASFLTDAIHCAAEIGAAVLVGPFCTPIGFLPGGRRTRDEWNRAVDSFRAIVPALDQDSISLAVEPLNRFETYFLNTAADARALCDAVGHPRLGILFDTFHANIEEKSLSAGIRDAGSRLMHVHACENDRGTPGSGHIEWKELRSALQELAYDDWLVIESFGFAIPEIAAAACIWRDLAKEPEDIAWQGLHYLRNLFESESATNPSTGHGGVG